MGKNSDILDRVKAKNAARNVCQCGSCNADKAVCPVEKLKGEKKAKNSKKAGK